MSTIDPPNVATFGPATVEVTALGPPPAIVARISGEVDIANATLIRQHIVGQYRSHLDRLEIDLSATSYLDSAGIAMLLDVAERLDTMRTPIVVIAPPGSAAHRVIELTGLADRLHRVDSAPPRRAPVGGEAAVDGAGDTAEEAGGGAA